MATDIAPILSFAGTPRPNCQTSHTSRNGIVNMLPVRVISAITIIAKPMRAGLTALERKDAMKKGMATNAQNSPNGSVRVVGTNVRA